MAVAGPDPVGVFAEPPRAWLLERAAAELRWAVRHGTFAYRVLTACRAWRYLEDDVLGSKVESGPLGPHPARDARSTGGAASAETGAPPRKSFPTDRGTPRGSPDPSGRTPRPDPPGAALVDAAVAAQTGLASMPGEAADLAAADGFVAAVLERSRRPAVEGRRGRASLWMAVGVVAISTSPILIRVAAMPALALAFWRCLAGAAVLAPFVQGQVGRLARGLCSAWPPRECAWPPTSPSGTPPSA